MSITRLSGGLTPADGSDPRTFPAIWNATADSVEATEGTVASQGSAIADLEAKNPVSFGTAVPADGDTLIFDNALGVYNPASVVAGGGKVLQVVYGSTTTAATNTTLTLADSGLSATITPTSSSSKILVLLNQSFNIAANSGAGVLGRVVLVRETTSVATMRVRSLSHDEFWQHQRSDSLVFLDSPNTTSSITYKTQFSLVEVTGNGRSSRVQTDGGLSGITLLEVAD